MAGNLFARSVHDLTAAAWFGGSLMGAVGLNGAAAEAKDPAERTRLSSRGWMKWAPVQTAAFATHLLADLFIALENKDTDRQAGGRGPRTPSTRRPSPWRAPRSPCMRVCWGRRWTSWPTRVPKAPPSPGPARPTKLQAAQKQLKVLQWTIPAFAASVIVLGAKHGEMQRPKNVFKGLR